MTKAAISAELELIEATIRDYLEGWYDGDVERMDRALHAELDLVRTGAGWKIANALWPYS